LYTLRARFSKGPLQLIDIFAWRKIKYGRAFLFMLAAQAHLQLLELAPHLFLASPQLDVIFSPIWHCSGIENIQHFSRSLGATTNRLALTARACRSCTCTTGSPTSSDHTRSSALETMPRRWHVVKRHPSTKPQLPMRLVFTNLLRSTQAKALRKPASNCTWRALHKQLQQIIVPMHWGRTATHKIV
jgi:hypothetical protein